MRSIIVVEQNAALHELLAFSLRHAGYQVYSALGCESAMALLVEFRPQVLIAGTLALHMEYAFRAARRRGTRVVAIVNDTHQANGDIDPAAMMADAILPRPFAPAELLATVRELCTITERERESVS
jgi:two-component system phosphate regulon response regulator PhoB